MREPHPHLRDHLAMWKPVIGKICSYLAKNNHAVFVLLGSKAQDAFDELSNVSDNVCTVRRAHPGFTDRHAPTGRNVPFLKGQNLFAEINKKLLRRRNKRIDW